jgi:hypothetical protein
MAMLKAAEALPVFEDEKHGHEPLQCHTPQRNPSRAKKTLVIVALFLAAVSAVVLTNRATSPYWHQVQRQQDDTQQQHRQDTAQGFIKHVKRAAGDRYLLGVGKADITGYAAF